MGQEILETQFHPRDFVRFRRRLEEETAELRRLEVQGGLSDHPPVAGFEIEGWLVDGEMRPAPENMRFLSHFHHPLACPELARFNVEFNTVPRPLSGRLFSRLERELLELLSAAERQASRLGLHLLLIGTHPLLRHRDLSLANLTPLNRYRLLNREILRLREGRPIEIEIIGRERLRESHSDVMLESATTSFQIHMQLPQREAVARFNASLIASAATVAVGANAPFLFGRDLWDESRIPIFEQAIPLAVRDASGRRLKRVDFGVAFCREGLSELFEENLHHPVLLPAHLEGRFAHLQLHNGTIWRWNRPLLGFDPSGRPHLRVEHRVLPAGPTVVDMVASACFYFGLVEDLLHHPVHLPFSAVRENFYRAARRGWRAAATWEERRYPLKWLLREELLPRARRGLERLKIDPRDIERYLGIIEGRLEADQNGALWQRRALRKMGDLQKMVRRYFELQQENLPVHRWPI